MTQFTKLDIESQRKDLDKRIAWGERHPVLDFFYCLPWTIQRLPLDIKLWCREKYGRAKRGWSVSDVWGFDYYLARVIAEGCEWLREHKHGCPCIEGFNSQTDEGFKAMQAEWDRILDNIIYTFRTAQKIQDRNWMYPFKKKYFTKKELKRLTEFCDKMRKNFNDEDWHIMTEDECEHYRIGWKYFQEFFYGLWD